MLCHKHAGLALLLILPVWPHAWPVQCRSSCTCCQGRGKGVAACYEACWGTALLEKYEDCFYKNEQERDEHVKVKRPLSVTQ